MISTAENLTKNKKRLAGFITAVQQAKAADPGKLAELMARSSSHMRSANNPPVIGITGTGGAGKSSLTDEIIVRFLHDIKDIQLPLSAVTRQDVKPAERCLATGSA